MLVRPEDLRLGPPDGAAWRTAVVESVEYFGHDARVQLRCEDAAGEQPLIARTMGSDSPRSASASRWTSPQVHT